MISLNLLDLNMRFVLISLVPRVKIYLHQNKVIWTACFDISGIYSGIQSKFKIIEKIIVMGISEFPDDDNSNPKINQKQNREGR